MADLRKVVIEIKQVNQDDTPTAPTPNNSGGDTNITNNTNINIQYVLHPLKTIENKTVGKNVLVNQAYQLAKQQVKNAITLSVSRYFSLKEDYIGQNIYNNVATGISKISSLGTAVVGGAIAGSSVMSGAGAIAGAVIGAVGWGVNETISSINTKYNSMLELGTKMYQTNFNVERYGLINGGRGTEN